MRQVESRISSESLTTYQYFYHFAHFMKTNTHLKTFNTQQHCNLVSLLIFFCKIANGTTSVNISLILLDFM